MLSSRLNPHAAAGALIWVVWVLATTPGRTPALFMLSPLVVVSLVLALLAQRVDDRFARRMTVAAVPLALITSLAFSFEPGTASAVLTLPWLGFTLAAAVLGALRLLSRPNVASPSIGFDISLLFIAVGGVWLTISRAGSNPLGFNDAIVELTAVHFHYAGFALPVVAAVVAEQLGRSSVLPLSVALGVVATAIGITAGGVVEWIGATAMAVVGLAVAACLLRVAFATTGLTRAALVVAGVALVGGMAMALVWAWTVWFGVTGPGLDLMVATHGGLNAIGFALVGLLGLHGVEQRQDQPRNLMVGRVSRDDLDQLLVVTAGSAVSPAPRGATPRHFEQPITDSSQLAIERLERWAGHDRAGILRSPEHPELAVDSRVALAIPFGPLSISAVAEIVHVVDDTDKSGFVYATTEHHPMAGHESFLIDRGADDARVEIEIVARPAILATRLLPAATRHFQARAAQHYLSGLTSVDH